MVPVLTAAEMREADRHTIEEVGLPGSLLMENAGSAVARAVRERWGRLPPLLLCGRGNNGGDGFVAARHLLDLGPSVLLLGTRADVTGDARLHMGAYERSGGALAEVPDAAAWEARREEARRAPVIVDALLGTGLRQAPAGLMARVIADLAALGPGRVVAVDIPSGVPSDTGELPWEAVRAAVTVTFAAPKYGHVLPPASERVGELIVADIGIIARVIDQVGPRLWLLEDADLAAVYPRRRPDAHKGDFGHVLVVAGSAGKSGAAVLAGLGALRSGAGLVTVATPAAVQPLVAQARPELMTEPLPDEEGFLRREALARALELAGKRDAVVLGPGLGQTAGVREFVREFVHACAAPLVVDADGLNALAAAARVPAALGSLRRDRPTVVTPHPGEMARLVGIETPEVQRRRLETSRALAAETGAVVVLKGQRTIVAEPGGKAAVNATGNPGLAAGGTGDVLAGILGALLARRADAWTAAKAAVFLHGRAGDRAAAAVGQEPLVAGDLLDAIAGVLRDVERAHP